MGEGIVGLNGGLADIGPRGIFSWPQFTSEERAIFMGNK